LPAHGLIILYWSVVEDFGANLVGVAKYLQQVVMDVHLLFFRTLSLQADQDMQTKHSNLTALLKTGGLISLYQAYFIRDISKTLDLSENSGKNLHLPTLENFDVVHYCGTQNAASTHGDYRKILDQWLVNIIAKISKSCNSVLSKMESATDVAKLQLRVWNSCTTVITASAHSTNSKQSRHSNADSKASDANNLIGLGHDNKLKLDAESVQRFFDPHYKASAASSSQAGASSSGSFGLTSIGHVIQQQKQHQQQAQNYSFSQSDWCCACLDLLQSKKLLVRVSTELGIAASSATAESANRNAEAHTYLWSIAFMNSFMHQVERLLRRSCEDVLRRVRQDVLDALFELGIDVDPTTLAVKHVLAVASKSSSIAPDGQNGDGSVAGSGGPLANSVASSATLFRKAESIRVALEDEVINLLNEIIIPVKEKDAGQKDGNKNEQDSNDPMSSSALSRALYVQCSQLLAQMLISLRVLAVSVSKHVHGQTVTLSHQTVETGVKYSPRFDGSNVFSACGTSGAANFSPKHGGTKASSHHATAAPLLSGLLLIGRVCWLLKIKGRFVEDALMLGDTSANSVSSQRYDLCSEDQFISACEIADTDGDGVLTYTEAVEVNIQASFPVWS
jgi:hypothetical protein